MKTWKNPEMKLFAVKMSENIAASGDYTTIKLFVTENGVITREAGYYRCQGHNIQDTNVQYADSATPYFWEADRNTISGCLV